MVVSLPETGRTIVLKEAREKIIKDGNKINSKWHQLYRKYTLQLYGTVTRIILAYIASFIFLPFTSALLSLLYLIPLGLGYIGLIITPDAD
jgi:hypothetical protein